MAGPADTMRGDATRFFRELREGGRRQGNVIFALIFKEVKSRSGKDGQGLYNLAAIFAEPAIGAVVLSLFWYLLRRQEIAGVHVALFVAVSYLPFGIIRRSLSSIPRALRGNLAFYAYQHVKPFDAIAAQFLLEAVLILLGGVALLFLLWWFLGLAIEFNQLIQLSGVLGIMAAAGFGCSLFLGTYGTLFPVISRAIGLASRGLVFLSAVIHPLSELPGVVTTILLWNPIAHIMEKIREYALGMTPAPGISISYPASFALVMLFFGFTGYYANRTKLVER
jgi:capsular polysaccharide transport system permease protein